MMKFIANYFQKTESYTTGRFIFEMYLVAILTKLFIIVMILVSITLYEPIETILFGEINDNNTQFADLNWIEGLLILCIILPFFESIVGQGIPIWLLSFISNNRVLFLLCSSLWFSYLHSIVFEGIAPAIIIFSAGIIFSWCFIVYKENGFWKGIVVTTSVHFFYNFSVFITFYIIP